MGQKKIGNKLVLSTSLVLILVMITGLVWNIIVQRKQARLEFLEQSRIMAVQILALREVTVENQHKINYDSKGNFEFKHLNPTVVVQQVSRLFNANTNYLIRQVRFNPRVPENKPDDYEKSKLRLFAAKKSLKESWGESVINGNKYFRYMVPLYFSQSCMQCHGEPKGAIDVSGYPKEGYKIGELAGAVSIAIPMKSKEAHLDKTIFQSIFITIMSILFAAGVISFNTNRFVTKPIDRLIRFSQQLGQGILSVRPEEFETYGEIRELKDRFTEMAAHLQEIYNSLEDKVEERTLELAAINRELARVSRYKSEFLANMSHEFRTPLTAILSFADRLLKKNMGTLNPAQEDYLKDIRDSGKQLLGLINDLLDLSKIESGKMSLNLTEVDIGNVAVEVEKMLRPLAQEKEIQIRMMITNTQKVVADRVKVTQVVQNLLGNAIKFSPVGSVVELAVSDEKEPDEGTVLVIRDSGPGISPKDQELIFTPFYQVDQGLNRVYPGTGLGLSLVKEFVSLHMGIIKVVSDKGQGTVFTVFWPKYPLFDEDLE